MEKIAIIANEWAVNNLFNKKSLALLSELGEVTIHKGGLDNDSLKETLKDATVAITSWGNGLFNDELLAASPNLKFIAHAAGSVKPIVTDAVWERGIRVTASANVLSCGVSETALGFTIAASKNIFSLNKNIHEGGWAEGKENIRELFELNIGVVGGGWAGRHYIELIKAFDVNVLLYDPFIDSERAAAIGATKVELEELLKESDIVSIHAPSIPETYHMFNSETLKLMKKDAVLINTARGTIIDEVALYEHMKAGNLKYACLDVTDPEPPLADNPLRTLDNCIMTPHLAGLANNGLMKIGMHVYNEINRFINGEKLIGEVTKEMLARMA